VTPLPDWVMAVIRIEVVWDISLAVVLGLVIGQVYLRQYRGILLSRSFIHTCVITVVLVAFAIHVVMQAGPTTGQALGFALVGLLGLIRFRTVVRDTREFSFMLLCIVTGVLLGAGKRWEAVTACVLVLVTLVAMERSGFGVPPPSAFRIKIVGDVGNLNSYASQLMALCNTVLPLSIRYKDTGKSAYHFEVAAHPGQDMEAIVGTLKAVAGTEEVVVARLLRDKSLNQDDD